MNQEILDNLQKENLDRVITGAHDETSSDLKTMIVDYTGYKLKPENHEITVDMVVQVLAEDFPEIVFAIAEENYLKGFEEGLNADELYKEDPRPQQVLNDLKDE
jgi:hypothetical protein|tara:strand:- start:1466 stop:1777 length:312 start_codon:yes stop_codon:yes gene_type:complete